MNKSKGGGGSSEIPSGRAVALLGETIPVLYEVLHSHCTRVAMLAEKGRIKWL